MSTDTRATAAQGESIPPLVGFSRRDGEITIGEALPREGRPGSHKRAISDRAHSRSGNAKQRRTALRSCRRRLAAAPPAFTVEFEDGDFAWEPA